MTVRKVLLWTGGVLVVLYSILYAIRFTYTLPIDGLLVDARTGQPVSKALVRCFWHSSRPNLVDTSGGGSGFGTVTDEQGRFKIPGRNVTAVIGRFDDQFLLIQHPLYAFIEQQVYSTLPKGYVVGKVEGFSLKLTLQFTSLEDKYPRVEDMAALARTIGSCGPEYYRALRDRYKVRYDLKEIMTKLEQLANRFPEIPSEGQYVRRALAKHKFLMTDLLKAY